ncbi:DUF4150 domain-containing protein [Rhizobium sp. P44RR-XXIV]|uniref:DUF4150 domain-containing protein n=1 Tax=Rhizobium sp. P44RR-XXIV TaxID=1921145 RepID=UPI0009D071F5|nr:DUF4150 domain-containing protein [Rhizobium sp. P44RR-XXIV]
MRDNDAARIVSLSPDVCKTPIGSSTPPIPYPIVDFCGHDENYTESVRFTSQKVMVLRSNTCHVHGDEPGQAKGVKSGTVEGICQPVEGADLVRAEGSPIITHLHRFDMNNRNTVGEAYFVRDTATYPAPKDNDPVPGSLRSAGFSNLDEAFGPATSLPAGSYQVAQAATGTMTDAGGGFGGRSPSRGTTTVPQSGGATTAPGSWTSRLLRWSIFGRAESAANMLNDLSGGAVNRARIENQLHEFDYYATTPNQGLTPDQMAIWAKGAAEVRATALPAGDMDAFDAIRKKTIDAIVSSAAQDKAKASAATGSNVRVSAQREACDDICKMACECMKDRQGAETYTECVARKIRRDKYDPDNGTRPDGTPRYPKSTDADGPRPEVSYDPNNGYKAAESQNATGMPSSQYPKRGMPRPDISWWKGGKLWKIFELKFPTSSGGVDRDTAMQRDGEYEKIAEKNGLDPEKDLIKLDVGEDCDCEAGKAKPDAPC